ncbi:hypothetical protein BDV95DRAFT_629553 [Massariosphaeria phaeospora]|uniref:Rhodopsin domain-containing protein n=1 Tax=Massariosphaeria phaeospora TaxID=100035 RepID=A0A7C8I6B7_9PLEO|nr:hypothetical protein BDV95DRAFT_629553 [Massariosphaeria phaeospora]
MHFTDHPDNANLPIANRPETVIGLTISFMTVSWIAISLRLFARIRARLWGWDDLFVLLAGVMPSDGMGKHFWTLDPHTQMDYFKHIWSSNVCYTAATTFIKLSLLFQYLRLFDMQNRRAHIVAWSLIVFISLWGTTFFLLALFSCKPIAKNWNSKLPGTCVAWGSKDPDVFFASWVSHAATNMVLDMLVLMAPIPFIKRLRIGGRSRIGLVALFVMGGLVAALSLGRLVALSVHRAGTVPRFDVTFATPSIYIFSALEINIAILCASIPIFWPVVTGLTGNKILVVNEIEIRTDRRNSQNLPLTEQGSGGGGAYSGIPELDREGRTSRLSAMNPAKPDKPSFARSASRTAYIGRGDYKHSHSHHASNSTSSLHKPNTTTTTIGIELGARPSQDSHRNLAHQSSLGGLSLDSNSPLDGKKSLEAGRNGSVGGGGGQHYQSRYVQEWVLPGGGGGAGGGNNGHGHGNGNGNGNSYTTTVERAEIPYDYIRALEK